MEKYYSKFLIILGLTIIYFIVGTQQVLATCTTWDNSGPETNYLPNVCNTFNGNASGSVNYSCGTNYSGLGGQYACYSHKFFCDTPCGAPGTPGGGGSDKDNVYGKSCPTGSVPDFTQLEKQICLSSEPYWSWWKNYNYVMGNAEQTGSCCNEKTIRGTCGDWYDCPTRSNPDKMCRDCTKDETYCAKSYINQYVCKATIPTLTQFWYSLSRPTSSLGCVGGASRLGKNAHTDITVLVETPTTFGGGTLEDFRLWFGTTAPTIDTFSTTTAQGLVSNDQFGLVVKKSGANWSDLYAPSKYNATNGSAGSTIQTWSKIGTVGAGLRGEIKGMNGQRIAFISDITLSTSATTTTLRVTLTPYHEGSGVATYEKIVSGLYNIRAYPKYSGVTGIVWQNSTQNVTIDLVDPVSDRLDFSEASATHLNVNWQYSDALSSINRVLGDSSLSAPVSGSVPIDDETSGVSNYTFGSGSTGASTYTGTHLWSTSAVSRTDRVDLNTNSRGNVVFTTRGFDAACNTSTATSTFSLGSTWMTTRAGIVNAGASNGVTVTALTGHAGFSADTYWNAPFAFYKDEADISSELVFTSASTLPTYLHPALNGVRSVSHSDSNNKQGYWYDELVKRSDAKVLETPANYVVRSYGVSTALSTSSITNGCNGTRACVVKVTGDLTINSNFVCDTQTVYFASGNININPNVTAPAQNDGCIFVAKGNVNILGGTYRSGASTYPVYDTVEAFMIADEQINIPATDAASAIKDGLLVHGSMLGFGSSAGKSFQLSRTLGLLSASYPALAIHYDNRYLSFAPILFGGDLDGFRREVGFKPL